MTAADSMFARFGGLRLPLNPADFTDGLSPLDPARATMAGLFAAAINAELGEVWAALFTTLGGNGAGLPTGHPLLDSTPVREVLELKPTPQIVKQYAARFPLLCVYRDGTGTYEQHTLEIDRLTQPWTIDYFLTPLDVGDWRKLEAACTAVAKIIRLCIRQRGHLAYNSGAVAFETGGPLSAIRLVSQDGPGQASFAGDDGGTLYYAMSMALETIEITEDLPVDPDFLGAMFEVGVGSSSEGVMPGLIYADTAVTITP